MKLKRIFAGVAAAALAASTCASFSASAAESYNAFLMFGDHNWLWKSMNAQAGVGTGASEVAAYGVDAKITKDGTYTVSITSDSVDKNAEGDNPQGKGGTDAATGAVVFCVDITGILKCEKGFNAKDELKNGVTKEGPYSEDDIKCKLKSIKQDGKELKFDASKVLYGNIEDQNSNYRIEIFNTYGKTKDNPAIDTAQVMWSKSLDVTFDIKGLKGDGTEKTAKTNDSAATTQAAAVGGGADTTAANTTSNTNTGAETGLALIGLALAGGAIVLTKKRK